MKIYEIMDELIFHLCTEVLISYEDIISKYQFVIGYYFFEVLKHELGVGGIINKKLPVIHEFDGINICIDPYDKVVLSLQRKE